MEHFGAHHEAATTGAVRLRNVGLAEEIAAGREVRTLDVLETEL